MPKKKKDNPQPSLPVNLDLVRQLETALEKARAGELVTVALVGTTHNGATHFGYSVSNVMELAGQLDYVKSLLFKMMAQE